jgi:hypothetical protein
MKGLSMNAQMPLVSVSGSQSSVLQTLQTPLARVSGSQSSVLQTLRIPVVSVLPPLLLFVSLLPMPFLSWS